MERRASSLCSFLLLGKLFRTSPHRDPPSILSLSVSLYIGIFLSLSVYISIQKSGKACLLPLLCFLSLLVPFIRREKFLQSFFIHVGLDASSDTRPLCWAIRSSAKNELHIRFHSFLAELVIEVKSHLCADGVRTLDIHRIPESILETSRFSASHRLVDFSFSSSIMFVLT